MAKLFGGNFSLLVSERNTTQTITLIDRIRFFLFRFADVIVPNSYSQGKFISKNYPNLEHKVKIITNFVDLNRFSFNPKKRKKTPLIIIVASVWHPKNAINFIQTVSILKQRRCNAKFDWYGLVESKSEANKTYHKQCFDLVRKLNVGDMLTFFPKSKTIEEKYKEADYFCLPSFYEGTPNVICEAMASGCPVICSDVCDNGHYVKEGVNGFLFNPQSPDDMADKIEKALSISDDIFEDYCINSRELAEKMLSEEKFINSYLDIII
jgi:glycosyltransferase involved in cell wall biosynthesis